jgi:hypothetical protein
MFIEYRDDFVGEVTEIDAFSDSGSFVGVAGIGKLGGERD